METRLRVGRCDHHSVSCPPRAGRATETVTEISAGASSSKELKSLRALQARLSVAPVTSEVTRNITSVGSISYPKRDNLP